MSKTDKTAPWRVVHARGEHPRDCGGGYPCKHTNVSSALWPLVRKATRRDRTRLRTDLAGGREPSVDQHRHGARWDAW